KTYRASTLILVEEGRVINPLIEGLAVSTSTAQRLAVLREQILGWDRINQLIKNLNLAKEVKNQEQFEELVKDLRKSIKVSLRSNNIVSISYEGKDPQGAQDIVKTITDIFIAENLRQQNQETDAAIAFINDQLKLYQKKVKQSDIARMQDQLKNLLIDSTEKHPMVIALRKNIAAAQAQLDKGDYTVTESALAGSDSELQGLKAELKQMREELATSSIDAADGGANRTKMASATNEKLYKLLLLEQIDKVTAQDADVNQALYNKLLERLETAKLTQSLEASKEGTRYTILDPARLPLKPISPNKVLLLFIGAFLGFCAGGGLIFTVEMLDHSFLGADELKEFLDVPLLGAISRIVTSRDLQAARVRRIKVISLSAVVGVLLLVVIIFNVLLAG
ncbi:MAG: GNVR domain-containing protein, partial [Candidatus Omnitrophota bacterium]